MKLLFASVCCVLLLSGLVLGQSTATPPAFIVADVHASKPGTTDGGGGLLPGGRFEVRGMTVLGLITMAYGFPDYRVIGGPSWLDTDRFDIIAKTASATPEAASREMLQTLLADRFKLAIHNDERPMPAYVLVPGKSPKLKETSGPGDAECKLTIQDGLRTYTCHNMTMAGLVERLPGVAPAYLRDPLIDRTGLKGAYDFVIRWTGRGLVSLPGAGADGDPASGMSLYDAVDKQLGLKIGPQKQPMPVIVIDHVNRTPTDNPPGVTTSITDAPTEFEVAEIKVSQPGTQERGDLNGGRLDLFATTLKNLITMAYDVEDSMVMGGPKWLDTDRFDVVAKAPHAVPDDIAQVMLRNLIVQKFKLVVHNENQPVPVYALSAGKGRPKLKAADPTNRSACKFSNGDGVRIYTCQNTTMAQFAEKLRGVGQGYIDRPVVDLTGLTGAYDFTVTWAPLRRIRAAADRDGSTAQPPGSGAAASLPTGDLTLFEAIDKQLGLKLSAQKHPMPVIVIGHADRTPSDN